jgi:hypothetical protein
MINRLIEIGRCYRIKMNVGKTKGMRISRQPSPIQIMMGQKRTEKWHISNIWLAWKQMMQDVHVKINPELPWPKQHSTRSPFSPEASTVLRLGHSFV